ncbi:MAG TPA: hypothetical protein VMM37_03140 [Bacteroidota bacterium]|nr:hypothetical protein [Bacteroidota bacterium]
MTAETTQFIADLQTYAGRQLHYPREIGQLIDLARERRLGQVFRDAIFHAKFAVKSKEVMGRIGAEGEGFDKLATEFRNSVEKTSALLKTIIKEAPDDIKQQFVRDFFGMDQGSFTRLLGLMEDLAWVKNWNVDGKPVPLDAAAPADNSESRKAGDAYGRIRSSAVLAMILMMVVILADAPVTVLGWAASLLVVILLVIIAFVSHTALRN